MVVDLALGPDAAGGVVARVDALVVDAGPVPGAVLVHQAVVLEALVMRVAGPPRGAHADGPVRGGPALRVLSTGSSRGILRAGVPAPVVVAGQGVGALVVVVALALLDGAALAVGVAGGAWGALAGGAVVLGGAHGEAAAGLVSRAGVGAVVVDAGLVVAALAVVGAADGHGRGWKGKFV